MYDDIVLANTSADLAVMITGLLCLLVGLSLASGQAPGDQTPKCRKGLHLDDHIFPAEWKILMDTFDYANLFNVWILHDEDGDGVTWESFLGGVCSSVPYVCGLIFSDDLDVLHDNWMFSQFISYTNANELFFNVTYDFTGCPDDFDFYCSTGYVTLYRYDRNTKANKKTQTNILNYVYTPMFGTEESSRLEQSGSSGTVSKLIRMDRPDNFNGFYMGIRDEGTCGSINRMIIYYLVCPARVVGLVNYNEAALPSQSSSNTMFNAVCAPNAHNVTSLEVTIFSATGTCEDNAFGGARCECNPGYFKSNPTTCQGKMVVFILH